MKKLLFAASALFSSTIYAEPYQLDVAGIIPGVSTKEQVESKKKDSVYAIGGYGLICSRDYNGDMLSMFHCQFGEEMLTTDLVKKERTGVWNTVSNTEVFEELLKGFTKKFKSEPDVSMEELTNGYGVAITRYVAVWTDSKGNMLQLYSFDEDPKKGHLLLRSKEYIDKVNSEYKSDEGKREY